MVGDNCISEEGMAAILGRKKNYHLCAGTHSFHEAGKLIRKHRPHILLIEPFWEGHDGIRWIEELAKEFPQVRILVVSQQSERIYAERTLCAGAAGYWMKNGSAEELLRAVETIAAHKIYVSALITSVAVEKFARHRRNPREGLDFLSDRELAVFSLIAANHGPGEIAKELGISRKTVETHVEHIKTKLGYANAEDLKRGASELMGNAGRSAQSP